MKRNRWLYLGLVIGIILLGLCSRTSYTPTFIYPYLGDVLYAIMIYFIIGLIEPDLAPKNVLFFGILICFIIETSQLCQADWLNQIRAFRLGGLVLGFGFLWSDLLAYVLGGFVGYLFEIYFYKKQAT